MKRKKAGRIRVFLIDDHAILRQGIRLVVEEDQAMEVVGEAGDAT